VSAVPGVSIIKEALEDVRRHQADCAVNRRPCQVFSPAARAWQKRRWRDVKVRPWACASDLSAPAPASDRAVQPTMALALHGLGRLVTALGLQACLRIAKPSVVPGQCQGGGQKLAGCRAHGERQYASTRLVPGGSEQQARIVTGWLAPWTLPHAAGVSAPAAMGPAACCGACLHHRSASAPIEAAGGRGGRQVGEVVRVEGGGFFPADLLLLASSHAEGIAYVETLNLDGESNLKIKKALEATRRLPEEAVAGLQARAGAPNQPHQDLAQGLGHCRCARVAERAGLPAQVVARLQRSAVAE